MYICNAVKCQKDTRDFKFNKDIEVELPETF